MVEHVSGDGGETVGHGGGWLKRLVEADDAEGEESREEKWVALGEVIVPGVATVEKGQRLRNIEV